MRNIIYLPLIVLTVIFMSCEDYLDVVPDDVATLDHAFSDEVQAKKYLFTCYSYIPNATRLHEMPGWLTGDEFWVNGLRIENVEKPITIARNGQNTNEPLLNYYEGREGGWSLFRGIRTCNTFIDNIDDVRNMDDVDKRRWKAEVKFLKAYYHYFLMRMYGPIPLVDDNLPVNAEPEEVRTLRRPFDDCVDFIVTLLDEAAEDLPSSILNTTEELGRITKPIALALKSEVLLTAASPLFNGNPDYVSFINSDGSAFFSPYDNEKWKRAADASLEAIQEAESAGHMLYQFSDLITPVPSDRTILKLTLRGRATDRWNSEIIWGNTASSDLQSQAQPNFFTEGQTKVGQWLAPTFKIVKQYYTNHGVPINEDKEWVNRDILSLKTATASESLDIKEGANVPLIHFEREPRFYADLGFNNGTWFGQGKLNESDMHIVNSFNGAASAKGSINNFSITGYFAKKVINYKNTFSENGSYTAVRYTFPFIRLAGLYLNYAEALNEYQGPSSEVYNYIDKVRNRAGLQGVVESWNDYAIDAGKPTTQDGLRDIIQKERLIEFSFENHRYWDLRRWKLLSNYMNGPIEGWNATAETENDFYTLITIYDQKFSFRDYLWPIRAETLSVNTNLVQNPGW
ncbi:RagB/SusD family nutrient uptake outer membrane protein [Abyssalbus ytuae]|uniref:RagB/SusD family nutrient uptake outer membrane protein n=1 Tax=Abyssalbus ytuae TaxID=2926907 RepID=A0A9E7CUH9_9FLAO|nr:RagB/SusD family nutrient uptake outer membrane protein [Abyssalbus ytuae]UOB18462.1 RagB/SusD family nutrient uptake outer membrane protein [Abyssalbus ytuae]